VRRLRMSGVYLHSHTYIYGLHMTFSFHKT
jgi:hypothetical protein